MTKTEVIALLRDNQNERGMENWKKLGSESGKLKSFGIGLTQLRKLAKQVGRDHKLAQQLWKSNIYDAKVVGLLIDEPKKLTPEIAEAQVEQLHTGAGMLAHVFASCDATLAKTSFVVDLSSKWMDSKDGVRRRCGFMLLYELSKNTKNKALDDAFFMARIAHIEKAIQKEENWVKDGMLGALMGMGKRNRKLNKAALRVAKAVGPVEIDYGNNSCEPINIIKHLTSDYLKKKFASS